MNVDKPPVLPVDLNAIPPSLKAINRWILWRYIPKPKPDGSIHWAKVPFQPTGAKAKSNDSATWVDYDTAADAWALGGEDGKPFDGLGFVFVDDDQIVGIDLDDCVDPITGEMSEVALESLERIPGYAEVSPSGTGIKIWTLADLPGAFKDDKNGIELYPSGRYFTVTGHQVNGHEALPMQAQDMGWFLEKHFADRARAAPTTEADALALYRPPLEDWPLERVQAELLPNLDPDSGHEEWIRIGMAMHHQGRGGHDWFTAWDEWSAGSSKYVEGECEARWRSFSKQRFRGAGATTLSSVIWMLQRQAVKTAQSNGQVVLSHKDFMGNAAKLVEQHFVGPEGPVLRHMDDSWFRYRGTHYQEAEEATIRKKVWYFLNSSFVPAKQGVAPFHPAPSHVSGVLDSLKAQTHLPLLAPPTWLKGFEGGPDPREVISVRNGLFHIPTGAVLPHTAGFFTLNTLPFEYDPFADCPEWTAFLGDLWGDDRECIDTLQEMFGYLLTADTSLQKMFMLIGPRRSGKGTIGKILSALVGADNVAGPTLASLTQNFGLQSLIGKLVALISDARAPEQHRQMVVERLLMMSGEDVITVDRKNRDAWVGTLPARVVVLTNEMWQMPDASAALTGRLVVMPLTRSFYGQEDAGLFGRLRDELPGIFNWALAGRARLYARGRFLQPASGKESIEQMERLASPVGAFVADCCLVGADQSESRENIWEAYRGWCTANHRHCGTVEKFGRDLKGVLPNLITMRPAAGKRHYGGVSLTDEGRSMISGGEFSSL